MLRLSLAAPEQVRLELGGGVAVQVRPLTTAIYESARAYAVRRAAKLVGDLDSMEGLGVAFADRPDLSDPDVVSGYSQMMFAQGLARAAITDWEGVGDEDGRPVSVTVDWVDAFIRHHKVAEVFVTKYCGLYEQRLAEGNASGTAPTGTSAAVPDIAKAAEAPVPPAPTEDPASAASDAPT